MGHIATLIPHAGRPPVIAFAANFVGNGGLGVYARRLAAALRAGPYRVERVQEGGYRAPSSVPAEAHLAMRHGWDHGGVNSFAYGSFIRNILSDKARNILVFGFVPTLLSHERIDEINRNFSLILCDSRWTAEAAQSAGILSRIVPLPPPIWQREERSAGWPSERPLTFLHVSNGDGFVKGTDIVIEAFARAFGGDPSVRLIVKLSGSGADHLKSGERTQALVAALAVGNVDLDARRLDQAAMRTLYGSADCYVHVPRSESLGMPPLEAAACGVPSILHRGGPGRELSGLVPHFLVAHEECMLPAGVYRDNREAPAFKAGTQELSDVLIAVAQGEKPIGSYASPPGPSFDEAGRTAIDDLLLSVARGRESR